MAGQSPKDLKIRIRTLTATRQITKAMELVASSKLRKAQAQLAEARLYRGILSEVMARLTGPVPGSDPEKGAVYVVIAGDRGLAGGYNAGVLKFAREKLGDGARILPLGRKAGAFFSSGERFSAPGKTDRVEDLTSGDCFDLANRLWETYLQGEAEEIGIVYTRYVSPLTQEPTLVRLLPPGAGNGGGDLLLEPDRETVVKGAVPEYLGAMIYFALCESRAAEQAARRTAMDAATRNAEEMIASLRLKYNRARQAAITQEITEVVSSAGSAR